VNVYQRVTDPTQSIPHWCKRPSPASSVAAASPHGRPPLHRWGLEALGKATGSSPGMVENAGFNHQKWWLKHQKPSKTTGKWRFDNGNGDFGHETLLKIAISPITTCEEIADPQKSVKTCPKLRQIVVRPSESCGKIVV
jgi:hypothetical protein